MSTYAAGRRALGLCDRCGFTYRLHELHTEIYDLRPNGLRVCSSCRDEDNPQLQLGRVRVNDPQSLRDPRPDINETASTSYFGWRPIGNPITNKLVGDLGTVVVVTS